MGHSIYGNSMKDLEIVRRMGPTLAGDDSRQRDLPEQIYMMVRVP